MAGTITWLGSACTIVSSVSLYDTTRVDAVMHYDITLGSPVRWTSCQVRLARAAAELQLLFGAR